MTAGGLLAETGRAGKSQLLNVTGKQSKHTGKAWNNFCSSVGIPLSVLVVCFNWIHCN